MPTDQEQTDSTNPSIVAAQQTGYVFGEEQEPIGSITQIVDDMSSTQNETVASSNNAGSSDHNQSQDILNGSQLDGSNDEIKELGGVQEDVDVNEWQQNQIHTQHDETVILLSYYLEHNILSLFKFKEYSNQ